LIRLDFELVFQVACAIIPPMHLLSLLLGCTMLVVATLAEAPRPNILLIMADDLGFSDLGCYGSEIATPRLDQLARSGLRFTQFYNTAKCHSSRVSLLTGLYCDQAGGESLSRATTLAEVLGQAGYFTAMSGKWHLSGQPTDFGFNRYWGHLSGAVNFFNGDDSFRYNGEPWEVPSHLNGRPFYTTHAMTDFAIEFLKEASETTQPFFLYVAYNAPHYPLQAPEETVRRYQGKYDKGWDVLRSQRHTRQLESGLLPSRWALSPRPDHVPAWSSLSASEQSWESDRMAVFAAMVDILDESVGRLIDQLKAQGDFDNTLILFCSDNGACPFERTRGRFLKPWDPNSYWTYDASWALAGNTPFRLYKQNQHEGGISSPMIVHWPKGLSSAVGEGRRQLEDGSQVTDQPAHLIDIMATALELGGASYPEKVGTREVDPLMGKSLVPIFKGQVRPEHDPLYFHFGTDRALRKGTWKLVSAKKGAWELYDMEADRTELHDLSGQYPDKVKAMASEWFEWAEKVDRLRGKALAPVQSHITPLDFRRDTTRGDYRKTP
jgi:arylsulfatase A-like enzyme